MMRPSRDETETEYWLKSRAYWQTVADKYAAWGLLSDFERAMTRFNVADHEFNRSIQISDCGCLNGNCNYRS